ncbi:MAG: hypothetical protein GY810_31120 [Aureispira sp.]|nr:hypothetical protein [Aureispira sp.]
MSKNLSFVIWSTDASQAPKFIAAGTPGSFLDGDTIELMSAVAAHIKDNNLSFGDVTFELSVTINNEQTITHSFQMESITGNNIWLIADPTKTNPNGSFSKLFVDAFIALPEGNYTIDVQLNASHAGNKSLINTGQLTFERAANINEHFKISAYLDDPEGARNMASDEFMKQYAAKREAYAAKKHASKKFSINLKNNNDGQSVYLIWKDIKTLSENILLIEPSKEKSLELSNNLEYELLVYGQNQSKDHARHLATIDKGAAGSTFSLN